MIWSLVISVCCAAVRLSSPGTVQEFTPEVPSRPSRCQGGFSNVTWAATVAARSGYGLNRAAGSPQKGTQGLEESLVSVLRMSVSAGERGPLITLSGEADITNAAELSELITAQLSGGTRHLAIDVAGLAFADSASVHVLVAAARTLNERGGGLLLLRPQRPISVVLQLIGVSELITIREGTAVEPGP